jgi:hypothetical protein
VRVAERIRNWWNTVPIGTRSILIGAHCICIHPWLVALAWWKLYGFPWDPRLWAAFFLHDIGYLGKPNMDGEEGEAHVELGAWIMHVLFDRPALVIKDRQSLADRKWHDFTLYHSRFYAKNDGVNPSPLCAADKLALYLTPWWLYLPMIRLTGEIKEYMELSKARTEAGEPKYSSQKLSTDSEKSWCFDVQEYARRWAMEHADGRPDTWTPKMAQS